MDLNQVPCDHMVNVVKIEEKNVGNSNDVVKSIEVEQRCMEVEENKLGLELEKIWNKGLILEEIKGKIRVLGREIIEIEKEIEGLKQKKDVLEGVEVGEVAGCEVLLGDCAMANEEMSRVNQLMNENEILECEKNIAVKEAEDWKLKCKELELRVLELEERLKCRGKDGILIGIQGATSKNGNGICGSRVFGSPSRLPGAMDEVISLEGTPDKRYEDIPTNRVIDNDDECDVIMDGVLYGEEKSGNKGNAPSIIFPKNKRKRDLMVVTSDDEGEDHQCTASRRALKIEKSDNEDEDNNDDAPIRRLFKRITTESESDDNIPISQLKKNQTEGSSQSAGVLRLRRRLVKYEQGEQKDRFQELENHGTLTAEKVADESSEDESESSVRSLSDFIVDDDDDDDVEDVVSNEDGGDDSNELEEASDSNLDYTEIISRFKSRRDPNSRWTSEGDMLSDFGKNPELCMRAVCALYRQQTNEEKACAASIIHNGRGFSKFDATRGTILGEFLTDGDPNGDLVKSVVELKEFNPDGLEECQRLASHYSKQLFKIYENREDPFFP